MKWIPCLLSMFFIYVIHGQYLKHAHNLERENNKQLELLENINIKHKYNIKKVLYKNSILLNKILSYTKEQKNLDMNIEKNKQKKYPISKQIEKVNKEKSQYTYILKILPKLLKQTQEDRLKLALEAKKLGMKVKKRVKKSE